MLIDFSTTPPTVRLTESAKADEFALLRPQPIETGDGATEHVYELAVLGRLTRSLMNALKISYDRWPEEKRRELTDFSDAEKQLYYPFAFMLACLDGNAFRAGQLNAAFDSSQVWLPPPETITQYIPDACHILSRNSAPPAALEGMVRQAAQMYPDIKPDTALRLFRGRPTEI